MKWNQECKETPEEYLQNFSQGKKKKRFKLRYFFNSNTCNCLKSQIQDIDVFNINLFDYLIIRQTFRSMFGILFNAM